MRKHSTHSRDYADSDNVSCWGRSLNSSGVDREWAEFIGD